MSEFPIKRLVWKMYSLSQLALRFFSIYMSKLRPTICPKRFPFHILSLYFQMDLQNSNSIEILERSHAKCIPEQIISVFGFKFNWRHSRDAIIEAQPSPRDVAMKLQMINQVILTSSTHYASMWHIFGASYMTFPEFIGSSWQSREDSIRMCFSVISSYV